MALKEQLRGTGSIDYTAFQADGSVDYAALEKVIDFVITGGVNYIVSLGTTGETATLSKRKKKQVALLHLRQGRRTGPGGDWDRRQ